MDHEEIKRRLLKIRDEMVGTSKKFIENGQELTPVVFGLKPSGQLIVIGTKFETDREKRQVYREIGRVLRREHQAVGAVCINESWMATVKKLPGETDEDASRRIRNTGPVRDMPDRVEAISCICSTFGWTTLKAYPFERQGKKIIWGEATESTDGVENYLFTIFEMEH